MAKLSDADRAKLDELLKQRDEDEKELQDLEKAKKAEEKAAREALAKGKPEIAAEREDDAATVTASESSVHALIERLDRSEALLTELLRKQGTPEATIQNIRTRKIVGRR